MLILCSNGLTVEALVEQVRREIVGCKTAALVVTADCEYKEKDYHVPRCVAALEALGMAVDLFDLDRQEAELLLRYDVVEFIGGNPFYLMHSIRENNAAEVIKTLAATKILIGWSAAAFVFGPTLELVNRYSPEMSFMGLTDLNGLALTELQVLPHYSRYLPRFEGFEETCSRYEKEYRVKVIRLDDGDGVLINGAVRICKAR